MATDVAGASGVSGRYASALYDLADEKGALDAVAADLANLQSMIDESDDFRRFIKSPILSRADQSKGVNAIVEKAQLSPITKKFLGLAAQTRRLSALPGMIRGFREILAERRGQAAAEVTSAAPLSDSQRMSGLLISSKSPSAATSTSSPRWIRRSSAVSLFASARAWSTALSVPNFNASSSL